MDVALDYYKRIRRILVSNNFKYVPLADEIWLVNIQIFWELVSIRQLI